MASKQQETTPDPTNEVIRNMNSIIDPWMKAMRSWVTESEKLQQTAVDGMTKYIDNSHKMARESLDMATSLGATFQKQITAQVERTVSLVNSFRP